MLGHEPLSVALFILMIEWMTQSHYVDSVRDDAELDPLFANLLRCHWIEEAQHAKLDTLMVEALAEGRTRQQIRAAVDGYARDRAASSTTGLQAAGGVQPRRARAGHWPARSSVAARDALIEQQHQALRWTYLGSGMRHENFRATLGAMSPRRSSSASMPLAPKFC